MNQRHYVYLLGRSEAIAIEHVEYERIRKSLNGEKPVATFFSILTQDRRGKLSFPLSSVVAIEERVEE